MPLPQASSVSIATSAMVLHARDDSRDYQALSSSQVLQRVMMAYKEHKLNFPRRPVPWGALWDIAAEHAPDVFEVPTPLDDEGAHLDFPNVPPIHNAVAAGPEAAIVAVAPVVAAPRVVASQPASSSRPDKRPATDDGSGSSSRKVCRRHTV